MAFSFVFLISFWILINFCCTFLNETVIKVLIKSSAKFVFLIKLSLHDALEFKTRQLLLYFTSFPLFVTFSTPKLPFNYLLHLFSSDFPWNALFEFKFRTSEEVNSIFRYFSMWLKYTAVKQSDKFKSFLFIEKLPLSPLLNGY